MRAILAVVLLAWAGEAYAQVGLTSREARVALVASVPSRATILGVSSRDQVQHGLNRDASVSVRLSINSGYRLIVRGVGRPGQLSGAERIWVKAADGRFHELRNGHPVTVADQHQTAGECQAEVIYRIEGAGSGPSTVRALPVSYDIAVNPVM